MTLTFGNKIKELRTKRGLSQEKLAEHLCVSPQSISKWERNEGYPDITYLIPLAEFFDITLDELMERDKEKKETKIKSILNQIEHYRHIGDHESKNNLIKEAYKEFPYDHRVINWYVVALMDVANIESNKAEIEKLCGCILDESTQEQYRYDAISSLVELYSRIGEYEKAVEFANRLPDMNSCREFAECCIYPSSDERDFFAMAHYINRGVENVLWFICQIAAKRTVLNNTERINILNNACIIADAIYQDYDHCICHSIMADVNLLLFRFYTEEGDNIAALEALKRTFAHEKAIDECGDSVVTQTSVILRGNTFDMRKTYDGCKCNGVWWVFDRLQEPQFSFDCYANDEIYQSILSEYRLYAIEDKTIISQ